MNVVRRCVLAAVAFGLMVSASIAQAQALKQLPAKAVAVIKINNPQAVSDKVAAMAKKMMLNGMVPQLNDPLGAIKQQLGVKDGLDAKGEIVVGIYLPAQGEREPRTVVLVPVTDYKAFVAGLPESKTDGNLTTFKMPGESAAFFAASFGSYAAISPEKELLAQAPAGVTVSALVAKELETNDVAAYIDLKTLGAMGLPALKAGRAQILQEVDKGLKNAPGFNQKFAPVIRTLVEQALNVAEGTLVSAQSATIALNLTPLGIATACTAEFDPTSYFGLALKGVKSTDANLLAGLPNRKYFAFGGVSMNPAISTKLFDDFIGPVSQQLAAAGPEAKPILAMLDGMRAGMAVTESSAMGYAAPTAPPGQQSVLQEVVVAHGDAKKIAAAQRMSVAAIGDLMKLLPQAPGQSMTVEVKPDAKTVDGVSLDSFSMKFKFDPNSPEGAQATQMLTMLYGGSELNGFMGPVGDKTYVMVMAGSEELLTSTIASAKKDDGSLAAAANIKAVASQLPQNRSFVFYVALDNIIGTVQQFMAQFGIPMQLKLPADLPPIGISAGAEGSTIRVNSFISSDLIENIVAAAMQAFMRVQPGPKPGAL